MAVNLSPVYGVAGQLFDNNGNPLAGGKIFTYLAGTTTPAATYTSASGSTPHSNPIILDGAGRVPSGEIWLTDGITYKFVVKDSSDALIGTYDNLTGINSNFVAYTNSQEIQTATAGQTVFNLTTMQYQPGTNSLSVFVDGVNQYGPGAQYAYVETDSDTVTFVSGLHVGAEVKFTTTQQQNAGITNASQITYYDTFNNANTSVETALQEHLRGNTGKQHFAIGAIPRCTAGVFSLLDDAGHTPLNVSSVTQPDAFNIRVNYAKTATKINTFVVGPDDALAPYGVVCGGDVGTSYANILAFAPFDFYCDHNSPSPFLVLNALWQPSLGVGITITKPDAATVRVNHTAAVNNDPVVASIVGGSLLLTPVVSFNSNQVDIIMHGDASGYVFYDGAAWDQSNSNNLTKPSMTWVAGNNLRIDHGVANTSERVPIVTGHGGVYIPQIVNIGSTYFDVAFYDYTGTKVTTPNTDMKIWYRRNLLVPSVWPDATIVSVKRGLCQVPSANFSNVAGNNFWVTGTMEY